MIEYTYESDVRVKVKLEGKIVGEIRKVGGSWQYFVKSGRREHAGEPFPSLRACQKSLQAEAQQV